MNFFDTRCQEAPITLERFGIIDVETEGKAKTSIDNEDRWIATVKNDKNIPLTFTAIDKCIIKDHEHTDRGRCDCMLTSKEHLYFIELKDRTKKDFNQAIEQLESSIRFFQEVHPGDLEKYRHKKAFACNRRHPRFYVFTQELKSRFYQNYGFRIDAQAEILVV